MFRELHAVIDLFSQSMAWLGLAWLGLALLGLAWVGLAWFGLVWLGLAWLGLAWLDLASDMGGNSQAMEAKNPSLVC